MQVLHFDDAIPFATRAPERTAEAAALGGGWWIRGPWLPRMMEFRKSFVSAGY